MRDIFSVQGKTALVTGGSRGIGEMIARGFVSHGVKTYISSRSVEACDALAQELSKQGECVALPADLSTTEGIMGVVTALKAKEESLDVLVNNAGAVWSQPVDEFSEAGWDKVMNINLKSPFFLTQQLLPMLRSAAKVGEPARIINIGSIDGLRVNPMETYSYAASKSGLHHLTRALAKRLAREHITVNAVAPGPFESKMMAHTLSHFRSEIEEAVPMNRVGQAEDMAGIALYLAAPAASYVTGAVIPVDGGLSTCGEVTDRHF